VKEFISVGGPKTFLSLSKKTFEDKDINELVQELLKATEDSIDELSTFDEYRQEVLSGSLVASPAHDSEKFWKQNIDRFEEGDFKLVNSLLALCKGSNFKVQTIALKDIGNFVIHHTEGRSVITELGGKGIVMSLMESGDEDVRSQALNCTQKIMLQNWAYIQ
jgi:V-type H+-transporting ATPase subunit H